MLISFLRRLFGSPASQKPARTRPATPAPPTKPATPKPAPAPKPSAPPRSGRPARPAAPRAPKPAPPRHIATADRGRTIAYAPNLDGDADPGEIVWTWV